jgi:hypothetical protein
MSSESITKYGCDLDGCDRTETDESEYATRPDGWVSVTSDEENAPGVISHYRRTSINKLFCCYEHAAAWCEQRTELLQQREVEKRAAEVRKRQREATEAKRQAAIRNRRTEPKDQQLERGA